MAWHSKFKKRKALEKKKKISEELMPIARHPKRWWNICMSEDEKREIEPIFTEYPFNAYNLEVLRHFVTKRLV